jgi:hypothetical protein
MSRCLSQVMKLSLLLGAALLSVGWALSESRPRRHRPPVIAAAPPPVEVEAPPPPPPSPVPAAHPATKLAHATQAKPAPPPQKPTVAKISGQIVDGNGNPRSDAQADLDLGALCIWIYTDGEGRFEATIAPGEYELHAANDDRSGPTMPLSLHSGEEVEGLILELGDPPAEPEGDHPLGEEVPLIDGE